MKADKQFEDFLDNSDYYEDIPIANFYSLPLSMQWGVYQDWADSLDYNLMIDKRVGSYSFYITRYGQALGDEIFKTRNEARSAAIEALIKLINDE